MSFSHLYGIVRDFLGLLTTFVNGKNTKFSKLSKFLFKKITNKK